VAKGADCKSAGLRLRRFESYLPHHLEVKGKSRSLMPRSDGIFLSHVLQTRAEHFQ
jgi:hypothetical protein